MTGKKELKSMKTHFAKRTDLSRQVVPNPLLWGERPAYFNRRLRRLQILISDSRLLASSKNYKTNPNYHFGDLSRRSEAKAERQNPVLRNEPKC
jgi:hypothetical protein